MLPDARGGGKIKPDAAECTRGADTPYPTGTPHSVGTPGASWHDEDTISEESAGKKLNLGELLSGKSGVEDRPLDKILTAAV